MQYNENQPTLRTFAQLTVKSIVSISLGLTYGFFTELIIPSLGITATYGAGLGAISLASPYLLNVIKKIAITIKEFFSFMITPKTAPLDVDQETFEFEDKIWASLGINFTNKEELKEERSKVAGKLTEIEKLNWHWNYMSIVAHQLRVSFFNNPYKDSLFQKIDQIMDIEISKKIFLATHLLAKEISNEKNGKYRSEEFMALLSWHVVNTIIVQPTKDNDKEINVKNLFYKAHPIMNKLEMGSSHNQFIEKMCEKINQRLEEALLHNRLIND